jgi:hypothetical protein
MVIAELLTIGPIFAAGGGMLGSDNTRSTVSKFYRYVRDRIRIQHMLYRRGRKDRYSIIL